MAVQIVKLIDSSNEWSKFMRAAHSNLQTQNTMYSHKKYVILQHLLLMRLILDGPKVPNACVSRAAHVELKR